MKGAVILMVMVATYAICTNREEFLAWFRQLSDRIKLFPVVTIGL